MICCVVGIFMVIAVILTVPVGIFRIRQVSHNGSEALEKTVDLTEEIVVKQSRSEEHTSELQSQR